MSLKLSLALSFILPPLLLAAAACGDDDADDAPEEDLPVPSATTPAPEQTEDPARTATATEPASDTLTFELLGDLSYDTQSVPAGSVVLTDGVFEDVGAMVLARLLEGLFATGDLDGDGVDEAAAVMASNAGGSGIFRDLVIVAVRDGAPTNIATTLLGDRVEVTSVVIENGQVVVDMITQGPEDPFCCPTLRVVVTYELQGDELIVIGTEENPEA